MQMLGDHGKEMMYIYITKHYIIIMRKEGEKTKHEKLPFHMYIKKSTHTLLVHGHFFWSTFGPNLVMGPKALRMQFLEKRTMEIYPLTEGNIGIWIQETLGP